MPTGTPSIPNSSFRIYISVVLLVNLLSFLKQKTVGLQDHHDVFLPICVCVCVCVGGGILGDEIMGGKRSWKICN